jgi:crossover junction endodeoxyribonuclease RuvC
VTCILGIDPGVSGAIAFYFSETPDRIAVEDVPVVAGEISAALLADRIKAFSPSIAIIERVASMPKQGVKSMFNFGVSFGQARGVVGALNIPLHYVTPAKWKKHFSLSSDKELSRKLAIHLFPACAASFALKTKDGRAEAALIARYGFETLFPASAAA